MPAARHSLIDAMTAQRAKARTSTPTGLYWSERGHLACAAHTPYEGSDTWIWERWEPLPAEAAVGFADAGYTARCETCGREAEGVAFGDHPGGHVR